MNRQRAYLDYNATAPLRPEAREAMCAALATMGNPSSIHAEGRAARASIERARGQTARLLGAAPRSVVFTSGGTEAGNLALTPHIHIGDDRRPFEQLLVAAVEHPCVLQGHRFAAESVAILPVGTDGALDVAALDRALARGGRSVLALQLANNETGVIQDLPAISARVHSQGGIVVCDAVQAAGRLDLSLEALGVDIIFVSAHKIGGPKGTGALAFADDRTHIAEGLLRGGGQERGNRAGTENVAAIVGFGAACVALGDVRAEAGRLRSLHDALEGAVRVVAPGAVIFGDMCPRLPNTVAFAVEGMAAETMLIGLDLAGVAVSSGSAR